MLIADRFSSAKETIHLRYRLHVNTNFMIYNLKTNGVRKDCNVMMLTSAVGIWWRIKSEGYFFEKYSCKQENN